MGQIFKDGNWSPYEPRLCHRFSENEPIFFYGAGKRCSLTPFKYITAFCSKGEIQRCLVGNFVDKIESDRVESFWILYVQPMILFRKDDILTVGDQIPDSFNTCMGSCGCKCIYINVTFSWKNATVASDEVQTWNVERLCRFSFIQAQRLS